MRALDRNAYVVAARFFRRAVGLLPEAPGAHRGLGLALAAQGDCAGAVAALRTYLDRLAALPVQRKPKPEAVRALADCEAATRSLGAPRGGSLVVVSHPPGASVQMDGRRVGATPLSLLDVAPGEHAVRVALDGYTALERTARVRRGEAETVRLELLRAAGLDLLSEPTGATVHMDGRAAGATPLSLPNLDAGHHRLEVAHVDRRRPWVGDVVLEPGAKTTLSLLLEQAGGLLAVRSAPAGAAVTLDDRPVGHTPLGPNLVAAGDHWVRVAKAGFALEQRPVRVVAGSTTQVELDLRPVLLDLRVTGLPAGATVFVDGEPRDAASGWVRALAPGEHEVAAWQEGYRVWSETVRLDPARPAEVEARLAQVGPDAASRLGWKVGTAAVAVGSLLAAGLLWRSLPEPSETGDYVGPVGLTAVGLLASTLAVQALLGSPAPRPVVPDDLEYDDGRPQRRVR